METLKSRIVRMLNEDHLTGKDDMIKYILSNCKDHTKKELEGMDDKEVGKIYKSVEGKKCNESHCKTRESQIEFILDNGSDYKMKDLKEFSDKKIKSIYDKIESECAECNEGKEVNEGKKTKLYNRFGKIKEIVAKSDKYDRKDLMKKSNDEIESIYIKLNEGKNSDLNKKGGYSDNFERAMKFNYYIMANDGEKLTKNEIEQLEESIEERMFKQRTEGLYSGELNESIDDREFRGSWKFKYLENVNEGKKVNEKYDDFDMNLISPEYFLESYINGQFKQCLEILKKIVDNDDASSLIDYLNEEEQIDLNDIKDWIIIKLSGMC